MRIYTALDHAAGNYDYSKDYWRLKLDGTIAAGTGLSREEIEKL